MNELNFEDEVDPGGLSTDMHRKGSGLSRRSHSSRPLKLRDIEKKLEEIRLQSRLSEVYE